MEVTPAMVLAYVLVPVVSSVGTAFVAIALSRARLGLFTTAETVPTAWGYDRFQFRSAVHRRAFSLLLLVVFFTLFSLTLFAADAFLVAA